MIDQRVLDFLNNPLTWDNDDPMEAEYNDSLIQMYKEGVVSVVWDQETNEPLFSLSESGLEYYAEVFVRLYTQTLAIEA